MLKLTNTLTRREEIFTPLDPTHVKMYVCGPTVYAAPHIGNARSVVVYDLLYRLLRHDFPRVTYARNITDVDDKINAAAIERGITIQALTAEVTAQFHADMAALGV
ncbi:MAG: class I tRNA ligase family protein, partial [Alphaproteobacteria bacterium]